MLQFIFLIRRRGSIFISSKDDIISLVSYANTSIISRFLHCRMWVVFSTFLMQQGNVLYFQIPMISIVVPVTRNLLYNLIYHIFEIRGRYFMTSLRPFQLVRPKASFQLRSFETTNILVLGLMVFIMIIPQGIYVTFFHPI